MDREEKSGFNLGDNSDKQDSDFDLEDDDVKKANQFNSRQGISKEEADDDANYDDDFDDDIEEDLPADQHEGLDEVDDLNARSANNVAGSGQGITVSQSLGVDPSVDSLALEDYDHVEPVERIA